MIETIQTTPKLYLLEYFKDHYDIVIAITIVSIISSIFALSQSNVKLTFGYRLTNFLIGVAIGIAVGIYLDLKSPQSAVSVIGSIIASSNGSTLLKTISMLLPQAISLYVKNKFNIEITQQNKLAHKEDVNKNADKRDTENSPPKSDPKELP